MAAIRIEDRDRGAWTPFATGESAASDLLEARSGDTPRVLVVLAGAAFDHDRLRAEAARAVAVVAADAGAVLCLEAGIEPVAVVGDFDSIPAETRARIGTGPLHPSNDPETNDLEKALAFVAAGWNGGCEVVLAAGGGVDGGRMDHALANLGPILREPHARISMVDGEGRLFALRSGRARFEGLAGRRVSVLPWSLHGIETSESGVRYPLDHVKLQLGGRGVSNEILADKATIEIHDGVALLWVEV